MLNARSAAPRATMLQWYETFLSFQLDNLSLRLYYSSFFLPSILRFFLQLSEAPSIFFFFFHLLSPVLHPPLPFHRLSPFFTYHSRPPSALQLLSRRAPDIYGIFLIARSLHSSLLAPRPRLEEEAAACLRSPRTEATFQSSLPADASAHTVPNCGQVLSRLFETRPTDIAYADLGEINPPAGVLESWPARFSWEEKATTAD